MGDTDAGGADTGALVDAGDAGQGDGGACMPTSSADLLCDGVDNDCDGLVDVSGTIVLGQGQPDSITQWAQAADTVFVHDRRGDPAVELFDSSLTSRNLQVPLVAATGERSDQVFLATMGESLVAAWNIVAADGGVERLGVTRILTDGGVAFSSFADGGVPLIERQTGHTSFRAIPANDGSCIALVWNDSCDGWLWKAVTMAPDGTVLAGPTGLSPLGWSQCGIEEGMTWVAVGDAGFAHLRSARHDGGTRSLQFDAYDCTLNAQPPEVFEVADVSGETPLLLPVNLRAATNSGSDNLWVQAFVPASTSASPRGWNLPASQPVELTPGSAALKFGAELHRDNAGVFSTFWMNTSDGLAGRAYRLDAGSLVDFTPSDGAGWPSWPLAIEVAPGIFAAGATTNGGERVARLFCPPQ